MSSFDAIQCEWSKYYLIPFPQDRQLPKIHQVAVVVCVLGPLLLSGLTDGITTNKNRMQGCLKHCAWLAYKVIQHSHNLIEWQIVGSPSSE